jgi:hypothetical protein
MTLPVGTKNAMLDGQAITHASAHTAFPGSTGANEVTGGAPAYARMAVTVNAASGGSRALNAAVTFDVPACTVKWIGFWNSGTFVGCAPNGGATPKNFMAVASTDLVYSSGHGWSDTQKIAFFNGTPPGGLTEGTTYFVRDATTDTFKVAATSGGAAIDLSSASSFGCVVAAITEDEYAVQGTHQLATATVAIPD